VRNLQRADRQWPEKAPKKHPKVIESAPPHDILSIQRGASAVKYASKVVHTSSGHAKIGRWFESSNVWIHRGSLEIIRAKEICLRLAKTK
jgi:hypothetical protein